MLDRKVTRNINMLTFSTISLLGGLPLSLPLGDWEISVMDAGPITWKVIAGV